MKKLICFLLAIVMTVSLAIPVFAEESEEPQYGTIKVEYSDARGTIENLDVMVLNGYVYAHMASFCERLGYRWDQKDGLVTIDVVAGIWYDEAPAMALHFRPGDTTVSYNPLCGIEIEYDAPTPFIENDRGIWVPLQYTLTLLGGSRNIAGDILVIQMPTANVLTVASMIMNSGGVLSFDWGDDFGYSETATNVTDGAARVVTLFEGLLSFDGSAWTSFVDWNAFDKKFGKTLAALMCTYSSDELKDSIEEVEVMLDVFADDGALGSMLRTQEALIDSDVNAWEKICEEKLAQLKAGCGTLPQYNMAYQQYERATKKQDLFSAIGADEIISIQDGLADATNVLECAKWIGYGVTYLAEFQQRDAFQADVLKHYFATRRDTDKLDDAAAKAIADYASSNLIEYTASKLFEEHALDFIVDKSGLDALMGVPANLLLLAWDIMSETIPFYSKGLDSVESREISNYAQQVQNDAYQNLNTLIASLRADTASISPEDCVQLAEYCYVYLKSCYIARSFAIESLEGISEETYKKLESKINAETDVNHRIVKYLSILGQADSENSCLILGFLPKNNGELLEMYSDTDLASIIQPYSSSNSEFQIVAEYFYGTDGTFNEFVHYEYNSKGLLQGTTTWSLNSLYNTHGWEKTQTTSYRYDTFGNVIQKIDHYYSNENTTNYEYDENGNLLREHYPSSGISREYKYNDSGSLIQSIGWEENGQISDKSEYSYDENGNQIVAIDYWYSDGQQIYAEVYRSVYDEQGHLLSIKADDSDDDYRIYTYDTSWNLIKEEWCYGDMSSSTTYSYDEQSRLVSKESDDNWGDTIKTTYAYDNNNNLRSETISNQGKKVYTYDSVSVSESDDAWKSAYRSFIKQLDNISKDTLFYLVDIDGDHIPEMLIDYMIYSEGMKLCTIDGSVVNTMQLRGWGAVSFIPNTGRILNSSGHHGIFEESIYQIDNGQIDLIASSTWNDMDPESYYWNDEKVTAEIFKEKLNAAFDENSAARIGSFNPEKFQIIPICPNEYSYSQIISILS